MRHSSYEPVILILLLSLSALHAPAQDEQQSPTGTAAPLTLEQAASRAVSEDPRTIELERAVADAREELEWPGRADDVALSLGGGIAGSTFTELSSTSASATLSAGMELLPQLTISGSLAAAFADPESPQSPEPLSAGVELSLRPLADAQGRNRNEIALERAEVNLAERGRAVAFQAIDALLSAVEARHASALAARAVEVAREELAAVTALAERDRATDDQVELARDALRAARQTAERRRLAAERAHWQLAQLTGIAPDRIVIPEWNEVELEEVIRQAEAAEIRTEARARLSAQVVLAELDLESARVERAATHRFTPELSATAGVSLSADESSVSGPGYSLDVSITARASDWDGRAVRRRDEDIALAEQALSSVTRSREYDLQAALLELSIALENLTAAEHDAARARTRLTETRFLYERGEVTQSALHREELTVQQAEHAAQVARATAVRRWFAVDLLQF